MLINKTMNERNLRIKKECLCWLGLGCLCASIHMYYIPMLGIILLGYCLQDFLNAKSVKKVVSYFLSYCGGVLAILILLGAFNLEEQSLVASGLGTYSANLNTFFNPIGGWSEIVNELPTYTDGQYEGFAYLGVGIFILLGLTIISYIMKFVSMCKKSRFIFLKK